MIMEPLLLHGVIITHPIGLIWDDFPIVPVPGMWSPLSALLQCVLRKYFPHYFLKSWLESLPEHFERFAFNYRRAGGHCSDLLKFISVQRNSTLLFWNSCSEKVGSAWSYMSKHSNSVLMVAPPSHGSSSGFPTDFSMLVPLSLSSTPPPPLGRKRPFSQRHSFISLPLLYHENQFLAHWLDPLDRLRSGNKHLVFGITLLEVSIFLFSECALSMCALSGIKSGIMDGLSLYHYQLHKPS